MSTWVPWIALGCTALYAGIVVVFRRVSARAGLSLGESWRLVAVGLLLAIACFLAGVVGPVLSLGVGMGVDAYVVARMLIAVRRGARVKALADRLGSDDAAVAAEALAALEREVDSLIAATGEFEMRARWVLTIAGRASMAGQRERALAWTLRIDPRLVSGDVLAMHSQVEAALRIGVLDREGARAALARPQRPASEPWEEALCALESLLEALEGDAHAAASRAARHLEARREGPSTLAWQMVRAHALSKIGDTEEARKVLLAIRAKSGDAFLRRVVAHAGPASAIAESVLGDGGAYR